MTRKSFVGGQKTIKVGSGKVRGMKNSGGGGVRQPNIKPHKGKTNP